MAVYYNEIDPKAAAWLRELIKQGHIADGVVDERSIVNVSPDELRGFTQCHFFAGIGVWSYVLRSAGWADDRPVWTGSCPCQPFSSAGRRGGVDDERHLWPHWHHLISQCQPSVVFGEQVASKDGLGWLDLVSTDMEATGYAFGAADLCAAGVGAPHIRQRLFFGANRISGAEGRLGNASHVHGGDGAAHRGLAGEERSIDCQARQGDGEAAGIAGGNGGLADAESVRWAKGQPLVGGGLEGIQTGGTGRRAAGGAVGGLADDGRPSPTNGHWRDADWLFCRDGKWRPVEPGTFPLAHGATARVGRLRGYGNAIVAQAAQTFIESMMEISE